LFHGHMSHSFIPIIRGEKKLSCVVKVCQKCKTISIIGIANEMIVGQKEIDKHKKSMDEMIADGWVINGV